MIATITLNPAVDKTMNVPGFCAGKTNRGSIERIDAGGKGNNVAQAAKAFGCEVTASGFLAGANGRYIRETLASRGIATDFVEVEGETRVNLKIVDPLSGVETEINEPGFFVAERFLGQLEHKVAELARRCAVMVFSGSLPPGVPDDFYAACIGIARQQGAKTILDTNGSALRKGLAASPDLVKPNQAEVEELLGRPIRSENELIAAARQLPRLGCGTAVVSLGRGGAILSSAGALARARPPELEGVQATGAGDAMVGALAFALLKDMEPREALRLATAAGSASAALRTGHIASLELVREMLPRIRIEELNQESPAGL